MRIPAGLLLCAAVAAMYSRSTLAQDDRICVLAPGRQARISEIHVRSGGAAYVWVERDRHSYRVTRNCLIQGGDIVRPLLGSTVVVVMPSGASAVADADHPLTIPVSARPSLFAVLKSFLGDDIGVARAMANVKNAEGRALDRADDAQVIVIPGLLSDARQSITVGRPMLLRWSGGTGPYAVSLQANLRSINTLTATTHEIGVPALPWGDYILTVSCAGCTTVSVPLRTASESALPSTPDIQALSPDDRATAEAAWLLVQGPEEWRLEALSRLKLQARDHGDVIAQAILAPESP
jgi:hypothetical protein